MAYQVTKPNVKPVPTHTIRLLIISRCNDDESALALAKLMVPSVTPINKQPPNQPRPLTITCLVSPLSRINVHFCKEVGSQERVIENSPIKKSFIIIFP